MLVDLHNHTELCGHASGDMEEYVRAAIEKGIKIFGFADHSPWMLQENIKMALSYDEVPVYISRVRALKEHYSKVDNPEIQILLGIEMDFIPGQVPHVAECLEEYEFDYTIGSVHYIGTWGFDQVEQITQFERRSIREIYEHYFGLVKQLIRCGLFNIVGHLDLIKKFGYYPKNGWDDIQEDVAKALGESGMVVEVNTSGMDKPVGEFYPGANFLCRLRKYGVPVTLGSDAHSPDEVGRYFDRAVALLKEIGYTEIMSFEKRERKPVPL